MSAALLIFNSAMQATTHTKTISLRETLHLYAQSLADEKKASARELILIIKKTLGDNARQPNRFSLDGRMPLTDLNPRLLQSLVSARVREGNKPQTIAHEVKSLRAATRYVADLGYDVPMPMIDRRLRNPWRMPSIPLKTRYLTQEEWERVYEQLDPDGLRQQRRRNGVIAYQRSPLKVREGRREARDLFVALTLTGGRWSEVAGLTWDRIDTENFATIRLWGSKTGKERLVPVPERVREVLMRRFEVREGNRVFPGRMTPDGRFYSCRAIRRAMDDCGLNRPDIVEKAGRANVHSLRHTFASWLIQNEADLSQVQEMLGHTTLQMTRRYAHLSGAQTAKEMANILDRVMDDRDG